MKDAIKKPDFVLMDNKNEETVILLKKLKVEERNIQLIIKLNTGKEKQRDKNSVLSMWRVRNSTYKQLIKNKKILYKSE